MDSNLSDMLKGVLSDPDAMQKLMGAAETLMGNSASPSSPPKEAPEEVPKEAPAAIVTAKHEKKAGSDERIALICALRPYLSPERRKSADQLIQMLKMMKMADLTKLFHT